MVEARRHEGYLASLIGALAGGVVGVLLGGLLGFAWMKAFPRPDFRLPETAVLAGILLGFVVGPPLGTYVGLRASGYSRAGRTAALALALEFLLVTFTRPSAAGGGAVGLVAALAIGVGMAAIVGRVLALQGGRSRDGSDLGESATGS